jgi:hypothetical protein
MTRSVRPSTPADAPAIVALFADVGLQPNADLQHLQWKYWRPRADWPGPRSFVLTSGSELIAHGAIVPGAWRCGSQELSIIHMIDWAARRGQAGAGVALMKHIAQQAAALLAVGGSEETLRILPHIGFRRVGTVTGYVRPLHPWRMLRGAANPSWKVLPRFVRNVGWTLTAPSVADSEWQARRLARDELSQIASVLPMSTQGAAVIGRSAPLFEYVLSCPIVPMALFAFERAGRIRGYFLLASAPGQVRIADCWVDSHERADWCAMILCAVAQAKRDPQAAEIVIWASDQLLAGALQACGFHARSELPIQMRRSVSTTIETLPLRVQMLDNDAAFFHEGRSEFWA